MDILIKGDNNNTNLLLNSENSNLGGKKENINELPYGFISIDNIDPLLPSIEDLLKIGNGEFLPSDLEAKKESDNFILEKDRTYITEPPVYRTDFLVDEKKLVNTSIIPEFNLTNLAGQNGIHPKSGNNATGVFPFYLLPYYVKINNQIITYITFQPATFYEEKYKDYFNENNRILYMTFTDENYNFLLRLDDFYSKENCTNYIKLLSDELKNNEKLLWPYPAVVRVRLNDTMIMTIVKSYRKDPIPEWW